MSNFTNNLSANERIYDAIRQIAMHRLVNPRTQTVHHTSKIAGYVVKVHMDASDELYGTVDVQEYDTNPTDRQEATDGLPVGLHEGVYLSAIQNNENGFFVIPYLYSDVVIETDPVTLREYVVQYSHADQIKVDAHNQVVIGVTETKEFEETENSPDIPDLEKTGLYARTIYTPTSALIEVAKSEDVAEISKIEVTADQILSEHDKAQIILDAQQILSKYNAKEIVINDDGVFLGSGKAKEPAVLGDQLASILVEWLGILSQMMTPTMMGPQPPINVAQFVSLQAKINSFKSSISGFLSKTVKVAE